MIRFQITGGTEIAKALQGLGAKVAKEVAIMAVEEAVQPIVEMARDTAPTGKTGELKRSIGFVVRQYRRGQKTIGIVGARYGFGVEDSSLKTGATEPANYAHLVEYGHAVDGDATAWVEAKPFLRPAWDARQGAAMSKLNEVLGQGIAKAAADAAAKSQRKAAGAAKRRAYAVALGAPV